MMTVMKKLTIFTDGGALGNPGPAAAGVVVKDEKGKILTQFGKFIGETTNNVAEYMGVVEALKWLLGNLTPCLPADRQGLTINFFLDSKLVVNQLNGLFKIKNAKLRELAFNVRQLEQEVGGNISYQHVPREENALADGEVKKAFTKKPE